MSSTQPQVLAPDGMIRLRPAELPRAKELQRKGYAFTEIARMLGATRGAVVQSLYHDVVGVFR